MLIYLLLLPWVCCGCSSADGGAADIGADGGEECVTLSFRMTFYNGGYTRVEYTEEDSQWPAFEDWLNVTDDIALYIFLYDAASPDDSPLLMRITDFSNPTDPFTSIVGTDGYYTVYMTIPRKNLSNQGYELTAASTGEIQFRIVVLANATGAEAETAGGTAVDYAALAPTVSAEEGVNATTFKEFMTRAEGIVYDLNSLCDSYDSGKRVSELYKEGGAIPIFGMNTFTTDLQSLYYSFRPEDRVFLGVIRMLRSVAKVRVVDCAENKDVNGYPRVVGATISSATENVRQLPDGAATYIDGSQVETTNYASPTGSGNTTFRLGHLGNATSTLFGYLPEQSIEAAKPELTLTVELDDKPTTETYVIPLAGNDQYEIDFGEHVFRNTVYHLEVTKIVVGTPAEIKVYVSEWEEGGTLELEYTDVLTITQQLEWEDGTYTADIDENEDIVDGIIVLLPWRQIASEETESGETTEEKATTEPVPLIGTFNIKAPLNATWNAYLVHTEGGTNRFQFVDPVDKKTPLGQSCSGIVDTDDSTICIVSVEDKPTVQAKARLQIVVTLPDNTHIEADLTPDNTSWNWYTIVQNPL